MITRLFSTLTLLYAAAFATNSYATPSGFDQISSSGAHTCGIKNGSVYCWGLNTYGQVGNGTSGPWNVNYPVLVSDGAMINQDVTKVVASGEFTCALKSARVYCWGNNNNGQLGDGTFTPRSTPVALVPGNVDFPSNKFVSDLSVGIFHACLIRNGSVFCWGWNSNGQLGDGTTVTSSYPVMVVPGAMSTNTEITQVVTSAFHTCALKNGSAYCWGGGSDGQLGNYSWTDSPTPVAMSNAYGFTNNNITKIASMEGSNHTCLLRDGAVYCFGDNGDGQLGTGDNFPYGAPKAISTAGSLIANSGIVEIGVGQYHTCAVGKSGQLHCWGDNAYSQLGDGTTTDRNKPILVSGITDVSKFVLGGFSVHVLKNGNIYNWGRNSGSFGNGSTVDSPTPVLTVTTWSDAGNQAVTQVAGGTNHACALKDGSVYCWGDNTYGQLGNGTNTPSLTPVLVSDGDMINSSVTAIALGEDHTCALKSTSVYCWGKNSSGQVGDGTTNNRKYPTQFVPGSGIGVNGFSKIAAGTKHSCAVKNGALYCWGHNSSGQLGDNTTSVKTVPTAISISGAVTSNSGFTDVVLGDQHSCAIKNSSLYCWGLNSSGQLGNNSTTLSKVTVAINTTGSLTANSGISKLALGFAHTCATRNGSISCWGSNSNGQLGDNSTTMRLKPTAIYLGGFGIAQNTGITDIAIGFASNTTIALQENYGWGWGKGDVGQVGDAYGVDRWASSYIYSTSTYAEISRPAGGTTSNYALKNGKILSWGGNALGQLGNGTTTNQWYPLVASAGAM